jgi:hypothetical protein
LSPVLAEGEGARVEARSSGDATVAGREAGWSPVALAEGEGAGFTVRRSATAGAGVAVGGGTAATIGGVAFTAGMAGGVVGGGTGVLVAGTTGGAGTRGAPLSPSPFAKAPGDTRASRVAVSGERRYRLSLDRGTTNHTTSAMSTSTSPVTAAPCERG